MSRRKKNKQSSPPEAELTAFWMQIQNAAGQRPVPMPTSGKALRRLRVAFHREKYLAANQEAFVEDVVEILAT